MKRICFFAALLCIVQGVVGCQLRVGPGPTGSGQGGQPAQPGNNVVGGDPAEQPAVDFVQKQKGTVKRDDVQASKPVIEVNLNYTQTTDAHLKELAPLTRLRKLSLPSNKGITGVGLKDLAGLKDLEELDLAACDLTDAGMKELAALKQVKVVRLSQNPKLTDAGVRELAKLPQLQDAGLEGTRISTTTVLALANNCKELRKLNLGNTSDATGDVALMELAKLPNLQVVYLHGTRVTDKGLADLAKVKSLEGLHLSHFEITDQTMKILAQCKNLRSLHLFDTQITDKGLQELGTLPNLKELDLTFCKKISREAIAQFIKDHPNCSVKE